MCVPLVLLPLLYYVLLLQRLQPLVCWFD